MNDNLPSNVALFIAAATGLISGVSEFISTISINKVAVVVSIGMTVLTAAVNWIYKYRTLQELKKLGRARNYPGTKDDFERF